MCYYNTFSFECGCESQAPIFQFLCHQARAGQRRAYPECDHHHHCPPRGACRLFIVEKERIEPGKCASHRLQAQLERKIRELKDEMKRVKDHIAEYQDEINEKEARRARSQGCQRQCRGHGGHGCGRP